ncbi:DRTGG domain-containing protein [Defluviitalea phaphyphila]|uniref:DRTGG domain-containing protein n=1 Tax=Defluviitalea phaphyphila TaxID=1473580 RepID=UPI0007304525|nr:DRTGG domain-containing protein [Defluviitalea phaphyphila]
MTVKDMVEKLGLSIIAGKEGVDKEITTGYVGDLLSWVMANAKAGAVWITIQSHVNIIAVASLINLSCIIVAEGATIDKETIVKANEEKIPLLSTNKNSYEIIKELIEIGIK